MSDVSTENTSIEGSGEPPVRPPSKYVIVKEKPAPFPWQILVVCLLVLLPVLAFPFGQDHSTFVRGGRAILSGGTLYVDFVDVKPPLIYVMYGIADLIAGGSTVLMRSLDVLYQLMVIAVMLRLLQSVTTDQRWLWGSAIVYATLYATLGYSQVGQSETMCALPIVLALWCSQQTKGAMRWLVLGAAMSMAFMLKYTLAAIGPAVFIYWYSRDGVGRASKAAFGSLFSFAAIVSLAFLPFVLQEGFVRGFFTTIDYLKIYGSDPPIDLSFVVLATKALGFFFGYHLSLTISIGIFIAVVAMVWRKLDERAISLGAATLLMSIVLLGTVIIERKFSPYHFGRLFVPLAMLAGASLLYARGLRERFAVISREARWTIGVSAAVVLLVLSPLPRYLNVAQLAVRSVGDSRVYDAYLTRPELPGFDFTAIRALKDDLDARLTSTDSLFLMSMMATPILVDLPTTRTSSFVDSHLYFGTGAPHIWRTLASNEVRTADWLVVDTIDVCDGVNLHPRSSWQSLQQDSLILPVVRDYFTPVDTVACFIIYKHN